MAVIAALMVFGMAPTAAAGQAAPLAATVATLDAQAAGDLVEPRWLPWLGCWELVADAVDYREVDDTGRRVVCVSPRPDGLGVSLTTHLNGDVVGTEVVLADGRDHPTQENGCQGFQRSEWSADGHRLYNRAEVGCEGGANRVLAGINMLNDAGRWLELQSMSLDGGEHREMVIRYYRRLGDDAMSQFGFVPMTANVSIAAATARAGAGGPLDVEDVLEIDERLPLEVTEAAILESNSQFALDSKALIKLADAGVEDRVIDLMVAVSFPDEFIVDSGSGGGGGGGGGGGYMGVSMWGAPCYGSVWGPYYYNPFYGPASLSCGSRYYSPYYRGGYYGGGGGVVIKVPKTGSLYGGKVLAGRGYARVRPKPEPHQQSGGSAFRRSLFGSRKGSAGGGGSGSAGSPGGSSGSAKGSVGPSGFSKGGSSGGSAKPKGGSKGSAKPRGGKDG